MHGNKKCWVNFRKLFSLLVHCLGKKTNRNGLWKDQSYTLQNQAINAYKIYKIPKKVERLVSNRFLSISGRLKLLQRSCLSLGR